PWLLVFSLLLLHVGLRQDVTTPVGRGFLIGHLGAVLLWQPLVSGQHKVSVTEMVVFALVASAMGMWMSWGLSLLWTLLLAGMFGGKLFLHSSARARVPYWLALGYLVFALIGLILPQLLPLDERPPELLGYLVGWLGPLLFVSMLVLGAPRAEPRGPAALDFVGSLVIMLVLGGVLLGALALMFLTGVDYLPALLKALAIMACGLALLGWAWNPRQGFAGLGLVISRHALSGGLPFDRWLSEVADLALHEEMPEPFVAKAIEHMLSWPGMRGVRWEIVGQGADAAAAGGELGQHTANAVTLSHGALQVTLHTRHALTPTPLWQVDLMVRLLAEFYLAKLQAQRLQAFSYVRAVHETGARVTHEVKNLLQSLDTLCFALTQADSGRKIEARELVMHQLPVISQRLHAALERIRQPVVEDIREQSASLWWNALQARYEGQAVLFDSDADLGTLRLPGAMFDTVADNLLRNALEKDGGVSLRITARFMTNEYGCILDVEDTGEAIPAERVSALFVTPIASATGLGIGLYQAARLARAGGFSLTLAENRQGCVRFRLAPHVLQ
ncbi:MAG TPA: ATP-binding protein, partial [Rhodocyclaceae bacterium]|nr:ATP-binding protein [Rhodocyclaceae bacterium]